jgi:glutamate dehydrogenase
MAAGEGQKAELIERTVAHAQSRLAAEQADLAVPFLRNYWSRVPAEDLVERDPLDVFGAAVAHLQLGKDRPPDTPRVRLYTPDFESRGWQSTHAVVEIVTDDMPFLVDSVSMELTRQGVGIHLVVHPVMSVRRDDSGRLVEVLEAAEEDGLRESFLHLEIDRQPSEERLEELKAGILDVLGDVRAAVEDWQAMRQRAVAVADAHEGSGADEAVALLRWLADDHFVFLGYREYDLATEEGEPVLRAVAGSGLGILRETDSDTSASFARLPAESKKGIQRSEDLLVLSRASARSTVHRAGALDYVGVKRHDASGEVVGEQRFLGLYTSALQKARPSTIPVMRGKVEAVMARADFPSGSHDDKALVDVLEGLPRHELFEATEDELFDTAMGILALAERHQVRLFARPDRFGRFWSCLVYVPLDRYTQAVRSRISDILMEAFNGTSLEYTAQVGESVLARLHFLVHTPPGAAPKAHVDQIEARLADAIRTWSDELAHDLVEAHGEDRGLALLRKWGQGFPAGYRADFPARTAVADLARMEGLAPGDLATSLTHPMEAPDGMLRLKLYRADTPLPLSDVLPLLEHLGVRVLDQRPYEVEADDGTVVWIHDFGLAPEVGELDAWEVKDICQEAFLATWRGEAESDAFNRLVLQAKLTWREVTVLRAYCKYLRQAGTAFSQNYMAATLARNAHVARLLVDRFHARFDPERHPDPEDRATLLTKSLETAIDAVESLDDDRILRRFAALVEATLRTNWFQSGPDGGPKSHLSFKLDPARVPGLPKPLPRYEIFVYSPWTEGVHLRGGKVARGGLRWSDRKEDFRTEILGLMKAQMVKNAVIVPVGAKGGFVIKRAPEDRPEGVSEVAACYRIFVSGLLDLTDNIVDGEVVHPAEVVCHDGDDPYLVVAADKGTATFSDLANSVAAEYGFWLGDAFASGGSAGYDHKKMGITARGAWESARRHFYDLGVDLAEATVTAVGIGDMSGDVFGNGMLLSRHLKLVAAFDHRHVFLDPDPDPEKSYQERKRLFEMPRSSWADYDPEVISTGGGVFPRTAKSITLSPEVQAALGVESEVLPPEEVVRAILQAPVDLLWNGGIGTYVKARAESHADVGDKANDTVRIDATELRCRVVAEGGNLGFTQRGRIEYALHGGAINTDAIDNSAGVDCSDHEVNIKILLDTLCRDGELTNKQRDKLLAEMTEDVAEAVLADNIDQNVALAKARAQAGPMADVHARLLRKLEQEGKLDRALEFLPSDEALNQRRQEGGGLTSPEFAVLLAYTKLDCYQQLLASDLPEDPWCEQVLCEYFPARLRERFAEAMDRHRLRREIVATEVSSSLVDRAGTSFLFRMVEETGASVPELARAHVAARRIFDLDDLFTELETMGPAVPGPTQISMLLTTRRLAERAARWLVRHRRPPLDVGRAVDDFADSAVELAGLLSEALPDHEQAFLKETADDWIEAGAPPELARRVAALPWLEPALDLVEVSQPAGHVLPESAGVFFALGEALELDWLRSYIEALPRDDRWQTLARAALRDDLQRERATLTAEVLAAGSLDDWLQAHQDRVEHYLLVLEDIRQTGVYDLSTLSVAMREVRALAGTPGGPSPET